MADVLVDTDVFVDHLRGIRRFEPGHDLVHYSVVTRCELYAGRATDEARVDALLAPFREVTVDRATAEQAGRLRRDRTIRTPDALIAASALRGGMVLLTRNIRDFEAVPQLQVRQP